MHTPTLPLILRCAAPLLVAAGLGGCATPTLPLDAGSLAAELERRPAVLLGEVHDNTAQHRARVAALGQALERGLRPALAFEQFDRERQPDIDRARRETPPAGRTPAEHVVEQARAPRDQWNWPEYRPFVELALRYDLPIVAANLSRTDAGRVAREGYAAVFGPAQLRALGLERVDASLQLTHERIAQTAHCNLLPERALPGLARAQIARDAVLAAAVRAHLARGVVLLTGNGHVRADIGVPRHLTPQERARVWAIGLLEEGESSARAFDVAFVGPAHPRTDPCESLRRAPPRS